MKFNSHVYSVKRHRNPIYNLGFSSCLPIISTQKNKLPFPNDDAQKKSVYLAITEIEKKWYQPIWNWASIFNQFITIFENRIQKNQHYKKFCVNGKYGIQIEFRIFYFIHLQNEEDHERKESRSA